MGTHCAMVVKTGNVIGRYERTLDGGDLGDQFIRWSYDPSRQINPEDIGNGLLEVNEDGEGHQEYAVVLDYDEKRFWVSFGLFTELIEALENLREAGWSFMDYSSEEPMFKYLENPSLMRD